MFEIWFVVLICLMYLYRLLESQKELMLDFFYTFRKVNRYKCLIITNQALRQILFNVLLYVPFGVTVSALNKRAWIPIMTGIILLVLMEVLQYLSALGIADIDDVASNTIGVLIGAFCLSHTVETKNNQS